MLQHALLRRLRQETTTRRRQCLLMHFFKRFLPSWPCDPEPNPGQEPQTQPSELERSSPPPGNASAEVAWTCEEVSGVARRGIVGFVEYGTQFEVIEERIGREGTIFLKLIFLKLADCSRWLFSHTRSGTFCTRVGWQNWCDGRPTNEAFEYGNSWQRTYDL